MKRERGEEEEQKDVDRGAEAECASETKTKRPKFEVTTRLKMLQDLNAREIDELKHVCADAEVMRYVGDSKPWTPARVEELCEWARKDAVEAAQSGKKDKDERIEYWHWAIVEDSVVAQAVDSKNKIETEKDDSKATSDAEGDDKNKDKGEKETRKTEETEEPHSSGVVIGYIGLRPVQKSNPRVLQVRVFINRANQCRGHAKRALEMVKAFAKENLKWCPEIHSFVRKDNKASFELFTRAGWQPNGVKWFRNECENVFITRI